MEAMWRVASYRTASLSYLVAIGRLGGAVPAGQLLLRGAAAAIEIYWSWGTQSRNVLVLSHTALKPMSPV
jgi:hypothetical protein